MFLQYDNYGFSDSVAFRSKAQCEGEGREQDAVSFAPLDKGAAIACEVRLAVNVDKLTELAIILLKEH